MENRAYKHAFSFSAFWPLGRERDSAFQSNRKMLRKKYHSEGKKCFLPSYLHPISLSSSVFPRSGLLFKSSHSLIPNILTTIHPPPPFFLDKPLVPALLDGSWSFFSGSTGKKSMVTRTYNVYVYTSTKKKTGTRNGISLRIHSSAIYPTPLTRLFPPVIPCAHPHPFPFSSANTILRLPLLSHIITSEV